MEYISRIVDDVIDRKTEAFNAVSITGPKGCGKTRTARERCKTVIEFQDEDKRDFYDCIRDIAEHPVVLRMKLYPHHGTTNCYQHCVHVAYYNYQWCRFFHLDARSAARGAMLHDLFLYDWHTHAKKNREIIFMDSHIRRQR